MLQRVYPSKWKISWQIGFHYFAHKWEIPNSNSQLWLSTLTLGSDSRLWLSALTLGSDSRLWLSALTLSSDSQLWLSALTLRSDWQLWFQMKVLHWSELFCKLFWCKISWKINEHWVSLNAESLVLKGAGWVDLLPWLDLKPPLLWLLISWYKRLEV